MENFIIKKMTNELTSQLEDVFIEGLRRKGFYFKHPKYRDEFIKVRCRCEDNLHLKEKIYYVDDIPFLMHRYNFEMNFETTNSEKGITLSADYGSFAYL